MSTIASPRPSFSSQRSTTSTTTTTDPTQKSTLDRASLRRNRAALRDYYNLSVPSPVTSSTNLASDSSPPSPISSPSELDAPGFVPETYVANVLSTTSLEGVLRVSSGLVSEIRSLDGEKKALVYDNYSKLIAATDTIRSMREKMDPMTPGTRTLGLAVGHIAETARGLREGAAKSAADGDFGRGKERQREVVRWVLGGPERVRGLVDEGKGEEAREEWRCVERVLEKLGEARGVERVRREGVEALRRLEGG
ncbi:unnamed protein product [Zymoseptoria tritici ST99CH_1A5]|uniref:Vacuolar protein sorting-associated protein 51 homolog n=3 Tax=Zymoseptoria tritici TaxID=1047171 RepID=F9XMB1_ZYMTI|nr:uncharacterized protein MYCGRDRAFT_88148 [Zymoseptoria tritici IPO323]EGP83475.1 hypothetical protein MYCGRDRAFT_88148 [Zymoseptoria tritici IPO323]SMR60703.1 unnamed protein product [Zymoseptoria tritici ST99CH_1E4]SMR63820.1 unnamed protein product [Zymoseptoria tritici ST99CH_3D1]SMY29173.1 unnamed protein product [Zymoseptoria tritici ST99CH_1A5]